MSILLCLLLWAGNPLRDPATRTQPHIELPQGKLDQVALIHATIVTKPGERLDDATLLMKDGRVIAAGKLPVPDGFTPIDMSGRFIYPGFIDLDSDYGMPSKKRAEGAQDPNDDEEDDEAEGRATSKRGAAHWNAYVKASRSAAELFREQEKAAELLRRMGITLVLTVPKTDIISGRSALVSTADGAAPDLVLESDASLSFRLKRGMGGYPSSMMGAIALLRQTLLDAEWHQKALEAYGKRPNSLQRPEANADLQQLSVMLSKKRPVLFHVENELGALRAGALAKEFGLQAWVRDEGTSYRRIEAVKRAGVKILAPLNFPEKSDLSRPEVEREVSFESLKVAYFAPENPARLAKAGIPFALTASGLEKPNQFWENLRLVHRRGLEESKLLAALTTEPAAWLGRGEQLGKLEPGFLANFVVLDGNWLDEQSRLLETWVGGRRHTIETAPSWDPRASWALSLPAGKAELKLKGTLWKPKGELELGKEDWDLEDLSFADGKWNFRVDAEPWKQKGSARLSLVQAAQGAQLIGLLPDDTQVRVSLSLLKPFKPEKAKDKTFKPIPGLEVQFPDVGFGRNKLPEQPKELLVRHARIWTAKGDEILEDADLLVREGKIVAVGKNLAASATAQILDATGKQITPGLIDTHSHAAIWGGVNEGSMAISSETRILDVLDPDDINIYRQLAGGLTTAMLLHGSSNPIGGQNAVIKLRWGADAEDLVLQGSIPGIKFALGENVKRANDRVPSSRYPQTRMGVVEFIRGVVRAAKDYREAWRRYEASDKQGLPPRRDLRMEAIVEILEGKRQIHCHSYRQDEILSLIRLAEEEGFHVDVFTHILEGYKIADVLAKHGAMASVFADWWTYKLEVYDAIPYNASLLNQQGVVTAIKSDDDELARRLNLEAAKAIRFGGTSPTDALAMVTINPARLLRIENRVGSLEPGKDADFVIWSGSPFSTATRCEQTWVDGRRYFDLKEDLELRGETARQRRALVQALLDDQGGSGSGKGGQRPAKVHKCEGDL